ncbi:MAG: sialidase family protein, partial [Planctomycetota bacterium]|nr:sialidase family protein [Planctomycetota bacterium]
GAFCVRSDDRGKTWQTGDQIITGSNVQFQLDEQSGVELKDGRIWMLLRELHGGHLIDAFSADGGETWQDVRKSRFVSPAAPPAMLRLADGRILLVWNNSQKPKHVFNRLILAAAISDDEGRSWRGYREIARTSGISGPQGWVCYPYITQTNDGTVIVTYGTAKFKPNMLRLNPQWLEETRLREDFSTGLDNWITLQTEGPKLVPHPNRPQRKILALPKPKADVASGASLNFPFGGKGKLTMRIQLQPGFQGTRICLTDHFTWPYYAETGQFGCDIWANGEIVEPLPEGELVQSGTKLTPGKWHTLEFAWDCTKHCCKLSLDSKPVTELSQMAAAPGVCYLRLWSAAKQTDEAGLLVESVDVSIQP